MRHVNLESCARFLRACGRGFIFQTATNTQSPNPYRLGFFLPVPPVKTPLASRASLRRRRDFRPDSRKFLSLLSVGTRALATPLRVFSMTYRQQVREVIWSGGGESKNKRHGVPELMLVASAHSLMALRALAAKNYCVLCGFLFFDPTGWLWKKRRARSCHERFIQRG